MQIYQIWWYLFESKFLGPYWHCFNSRRKYKSSNIQKCKQLLYAGEEQLKVTLLTFKAYNSQLLYISRMIEQDISLIRCISRFLISKNNDFPLKNHQNSQSSGQRENVKCIMLSINASAMAKYELRLEWMLRDIKFRSKMNLSIWSSNNWEKVIWQKTNGVNFLNSYTQLYLALATNTCCHERKLCHILTKNTEDPCWYYYWTAC